MKKIFTLMLIVMVSVSTMAEVLKFKASDYASRRQTDYGWTEWSDWTASSDIIVVNTDKEKIKIYGSREEGYDIMSSDEFHDSDGDHWFTFDCVDDEGYHCEVQFRAPVDGTDMQFYVRYQALEWVYVVELK